MKYYALFSSASLFRNIDTSVKRSDAITAVINPSIWKPRTIKLTPQSRKTLIRKAVIPKVTIESGRKRICKTGFINVLMTPITIAATTTDIKLSKENPGTRYETTSKVKTFRANLRINFILI